MNDYNYSIPFGGKRLICSFQFPETINYFDHYGSVSEKEADPVAVYETEWEYWEQNGVKRTAYSEYSFLTTAVSDRLLDYGRCVFHSVALKFKGKAYLISAPPGTGKSTVAAELIRSAPADFSIICGDRPILEQTESGEIMVHPSPWNGKENWKGASKAPLAGVIHLRRGEEDFIAVLKPDEAALPVFRSLIHSYKDAETIKKAADMTSDIIDSTDVYQLTDNTLDGCSKLLAETVFGK